MATLPTILVVDDEPAITRLLKDRLERELSVCVLEAASGAAALDILRAGPPDVIVTDERMPGMSGVALLREAAKVAPNVPRVMLTAQTDLSLAIEAINELQVAAFFSKPIDMPRLVATIRSILARRAADAAKEAGFQQAARVFSRESTLRGEKDRPAPFVGLLRSEESQDRGGPG